MSAPEWALAAALTTLERITPTRLRVLLGGHSPGEAWAWVSGAVAPPPGSLVAKLLAHERLGARWAAQVRSGGGDALVAQVAERCAASGIAVSHLGQPEHPSWAVHDRLPAPVVFSRGDRGLTAGRRVAIVGTRNATASGRAIAGELGQGLAAAGVHVVSGLARGIDGCAHRGALAAGPGVGRPIAVVASGCDRPYPPEHARLWNEVAEGGLLITEAPPGAPPLPHRFPLRNRLIAGLSEIVIVVESRERGGSLITAALAAERGVPVMAVPGGVHTRAAAGVNSLLRDGASPVLDVDDVLVALELDHRLSSIGVGDERPAPRADDLAALTSCRQQARTVGEVALATGTDVVAAAMSLARLEQVGWLVQVDGWYEAVDTLAARSPTFGPRNEYSPGR